MHRSRSIDHLLLILEESEKVKPSALRSEQFKQLFHLRAPLRLQNIFRGIRELVESQIDRATIYQAFQKTLFRWNSIGVLTKKLK